jgi:hypothetical protein
VNPVDLVRAFVPMPSVIVGGTVLALVMIVVAVLSHDS